MIDSLGPNLTSPRLRLDTINELQDASASEGKLHKAELCLEALKISRESSDIEQSLCKIIMNLTGEFSL